MDKDQLNQMVAFFLAWEKHSRDVIDFKKIYVDMAGDLVSGLVLSQTVYWHLPGADGVTRLRVNRDGHLWIAKKREDWWNEIRITPKQLDRALPILEEKNLVYTALYGFAGTPTKHIRLNWPGFLSAWLDISTFGENAFLPNVEMHFDERLKSNTENTTENTTDSFPKGKRAKNSLKRYDERLAAEKPSKTDPILRALALELFNCADDPLAISAAEGRLKPIMFGQKNGKIIIGLVEWEVKQNNGVPDYAGIAAAIPGYAQFCIEHNTSGGKIVTSEDKFLTYWMEYRSHSKVDPSQDMLDDPERPGVKITRAQLDDRLAQRRLYEQSRK